MSMNIEVKMMYDIVKKNGTNKEYKILNIWNKDNNTVYYTLKGDGRNSEHTDVHRRGD